MIERLIIAGYGGQGILTLGKLLAQCAITHGLEVSYLPSYGTEVRGGTANCNLVVSDSEILSPVVEQADSLIAMNSASLSRFASDLREGGLLIVNRSLVDDAEARAAGRDATLLSIDATNLAAELGNVVVANMILAGAYLEARPIVPMEKFVATLEHTLGEKKAALLAINRQALLLGAEAAARQGARA